MSWYKDLSASQAYKYRWPITVYNSGASGSPNVRITIPTAWDEFWNTVLSTGFDVRFTSHDGLTVLAYERASWTYASHTATFDVSAVPSPAAGVAIFWMYWGQASAADGAGAAVAHSLTGQVSLMRPDPRRLFAYRPSTPASTRPPDTIAKTANEKILVWVNYAAAIGRRIGVANDRDIYDEAASMVMDVQIAGATQAAMFDQSEVIAIGRRTPLIGLWVQAGTTGSDYTVIGKMTSSEGLIMEHRVRMQVRTTSEQ